MVLVDLLSAVGGLLRVKETADIDNAVFKLHYRITTSMLFAFCILVTAKGLVGDPINCVHGDNPRLQDDVVNTYCWIHTTFTLPKYLHKPMGKNKPILYPGIGIEEDDDEKIYHAYYQWVPFALFLQGIFFYAPHWLWKAWEGRRMDAMVMGLSNPVISFEERKEKIKILADYLASSLNHHNCYAFKFFICEFLNFMNAIFNMWFLDKFLGGMFFNVGIEALQFINREQEDRTDPLIVLFPRVTKCTFRIYGVSGTMEKHDLMCVLALNVLNEKLYIFLWFWFIFLAVVSALGIIYRGIIYCLPVIRIALLQKKAKIRYKDATKVMLKRLQTGDCFILHLLSKNIELLSFNALIEEIYLRFDSAARGDVNADIELSLRASDENYGLINSRT